MFKRILSLFLTVMLVTSGAFAARKNEVMQKRIFLQDGSSHIVNTVIRNGISLMEVRSFAEVMNFELYFEKDGAKKVVRLVDYPVGLSLHVDSTKARQYDGMTNNDLRANYATTVIDGRTYVPARFLVESLGYNISLEDKGYYISKNTREVKEEKSQPTQNYQPPQKINNVDMYYSKFRYKDKTADILAIYDDGNYLIDIKGFADLCGLQSSLDNKSGEYIGSVSGGIEKFKNGEKTPVVFFRENVATYFYYDLQSHENKYLEARTHARMVGSIFFAPTLDLMYALGFKVEYSEKDKILEIKEI